MNRQGGMSVKLAFLLMLVAVLSLYLYQTTCENPELLKKISCGSLRSRGVEKFSEIEEPEGTPAEINNETLEELDSLMLEIDSASEDDISDLSL